MNGQACVDRCVGSQAAAQRKGQDPRLVGGCAQQCEPPQCGKRRHPVLAQHNTTVQCIMYLTVLTARWSWLCCCHVRPAAAVCRSLAGISMYTVNS